jgi:acyl-CoA thioesterase-2
MASTPPGVRPFEQLLAVEPAGDDVFTARLESHGGLSYGGQTLGCATLAAARTCAERALHALHAIFLRPVPPETPVDFVVERVRDGRRFAHRRVLARQGGRLLCEIFASFASPGSGDGFGDAIAGEVPDPDGLPDDATVARIEGWRDWVPGPLEWRWIGTPWKPAPGDASRYRAWVRPRWPLTDDAAVRAAVLPYLADFHSHWPVARIRRGSFETTGFVSLDQVVWVHRDEPWHGWRLITSECDVANAGRALSRRQLFTRDGRPIATMAQEALIPPS